MFRQPKIVINYSPYVSSNELKVIKSDPTKKIRRLQRAHLDNTNSNQFNRVRLTKCTYISFLKIVFELLTALHNIQLRPKLYTSMYALLFTRLTMRHHHEFTNTRASNELSINKSMFLERNYCTYLCNDYRVMRISD